MTVREIIKELEILAPPGLAMSWDNSGLLAGHPETEVRKVYISLDATGAAVDLAAREGCDLILTHHPLIFSPLKSVTDEDFIGRRILTIIENHMALYAMHTNFDCVVMGEIVADKVGQKVQRPLETVAEEDGKMLGIGTIGPLKEKLLLEELACRIKEIFDLPQVRFFGDQDREIEIAAVCPGSGKGMADAALQAGCDVLITGDIDHHEGIDSVEKGLCVIDAGHHGLEHIFVDYMAEWMRAKHPEITVIRDSNHSPFYAV